MKMTCFTCCFHFFNGLEFSLKNWRNYAGHCQDKMAGKTINLYISKIKINVSYLVSINMNRTQKR